MSQAATCAAASFDAGESLAGTATEGTRWLLVEVRGAWGRDAVSDSALSAPVRSWLDAFAGKVILVRRPDRRRGATVIVATANESGGTATRHELASVDDVTGVDLERGEVVTGPVVLVCAHGRRDACCARLGPPLYDALTAQLPNDRLWQASHLGGHRFAPNVLVLPYGVQLGRIPVERATDVVRLLETGRIPLDLYRGRTIYPAGVQAAEIAIRSGLGLDRIGDLRLVAQDGERVVFETPSGELETRVEELPGPAVPASCGVDPEPTIGWVASIVG